MARLFQMKEKLVREYNKLLSSNNRQLFISIHVSSSFLPICIFNIYWHQLKVEKNTFHLCCWGLFCHLVCSIWQGGPYSKKRVWNKHRPHYWSNPISRFYKHWWYLRKLPTNKTPSKWTHPEYFITYIVTFLLSTSWVSIQNKNPFIFKSICVLLLVNRNWNQRTKLWS